MLTTTQDAVHPARSAQGDYLTCAEAEALWGMAPNTFRRKRRAAGIRFYPSDKDERVRLLRRADLVAALGQPINQPHR